jgi:hypothetical protein
LTVVVRFHEPVTLARFGSRKALCEYCYEVVSRGVAEALAGRRQPVKARPESTLNPAVGALVPGDLTERRDKEAAGQGADKAPPA